MVHRATASVPGRKNSDATKERNVNWRYWNTCLKTARRAGFAFAQNGSLSHFQKIYRGLCDNKELIPTGMEGNEVSGCRSDCHSKGVTKH